MRTGRQRVQCSKSLVAVVLRPLDRFRQGIVFLQKLDGLFQITILDFLAFQATSPEVAICISATGNGQHHRQCDLAFAEIIADILARSAEEPP